MKIKTQLKRSLMTGFISLLVSGTTYWITRLYFRIPGEFGESPSLLERIAGPTHLFFGFFFCFLLGRIWSEHIVPARLVSQNRITGWLILIIVSALVISGIGMLYSSQDIISLLEQIHPWIGISLIPALLVHVMTKPKPPAPSQTGF